jgi:hypothetical protein
VRSRLALVVALSLLLSGCGVSGLSFVQDDRIDVIAPEDRADVTLPVTVRWTVEDFDGTFGVFVDRAPVPAGKTLEWLARDDDVCKATPQCPSTEWFADRNVYTTAETEITLDDIPELDRDESRELHEVAIILLDDDGRRIGESAFDVEFRLDEEDDS